MATETLTHVYTTKDEMEAIFSTDGIELRFDDDGDGSLSAAELLDLDETRFEATDELNFYLLPRYQAVDLVDNRWVRRAASYFGCHIASRRRGNPDQYSTEVERLTKRLEQIHSGASHIPRLPAALDETPGHSNLVIDDRFWKSKLRVEPENSTGGTYPEQDLDRRLGLDL